MKLRLSEEEVAGALSDLAPRHIEGLESEGPFSYSPDQAVDIPFEARGHTYLLSSGITPGLIVKVLADWQNMQPLIDENEALRGRIRRLSKAPSDPDEGLVRDNQILANACLEQKKQIHRLRQEKGQLRVRLCRRRRRPHSRRPRGRRTGQRRDTRMWRAPAA